MKELRLILLCCFATSVLFTSGSAQTWAEKLGFPAGKKVIILHADDVGMCNEANKAAIAQLQSGAIQSASAMVPCPAFEEMAQWTSENSKFDVGLHLTLTSEWQTHRWSTVMPKNLVKGLVDDDGKMWHSVKQVVEHASAEDVERELRAQIETAIRAGLRPSHIDTHMGTLYGDNDFTEIYFQLAEEYEIPAMVIDFSNKELIDKFKKQGYPITERLIKMLENYRLPKLDYFTSVAAAETYPEKKEAFKKLILNLPTGLSEIIFHPAVETDELKAITNSWRQRVWEAQMFDDPDIIKFLKEQDIVFTNWKEIMARYK